MQILVMYNSLKPFQGAKGNINTREAHFPTSLSQQLLIIIVGNNF